MIVEIPKNSANKYEFDGKLGVFRLDRPLYSPLHYPGDYGFVPGTLAEDGDPLDVLVLMSEPRISMRRDPSGVTDGKCFNSLGVPTTSSFESAPVAVPR